MTQEKLKISQCGNYEQSPNLGCVGCVGFDNDQLCDMLEPQGCSHIKWIPRRSDETVQHENAIRREIIEDKIALIRKELDSLEDEVRKLR